MSFSFTRRGLRAAARCLIAGAVSAMAAGVGPARASGDPIEDIVEVLRAQGLIDEATEQKILAKSQQRRVPAAPAVGDGFEFVKGFEWSGDMRLRNEQFWYDSSLGQGESDDRNRFRYRARIGFEKQITETVRMGMRLATGTDLNSTNETFGDEFVNDPILVDRIWAELALPDCDCGWGTRVVGGKFANPFIWNNGFDGIIWDSDISPEGFYVSSSRGRADGGRLHATLGYFVIDENSTSKDPKLFAAQLGGSARLADGVEAGLRVSGYEWRSLDSDFIDASTDGGTAPTTGGNLTGAFDGKARVGQASAYVRFGSGDWPVLLHGTWLRNFTADAVGGLGDEDTAWGGGFEIGSARRLFKLAAGYFRVEANATPSRFTDSDLFDGFTNREGIRLAAERQLVERVTLRMEFFDGEEIRTMPVAPIFGSITRNGDRADRKRFRTDLEFKF